MRTTCWAWCVLVLAASVVGSSRPALSQQRSSTFVVGVAELRSGAPIAGAEVFLPEIRMLRRTDSLGQTQIPGVPLGVHRVRVRLIGYVASDIQLKFEGDTTGAVFRLERSAIPLANVNVSADEVPIRLKDFEMRRKQGIGRFLTEAELTRDANRDFVDVATVRFPGLVFRTDEVGHRHIASTRSNCGSTATRGTGGNARILASGGRVKGAAGSGGSGGEGGNTLSGSCESTRPCFVQVYLDDIVLGQVDDDLIRTWDLAGAEYYTSASMPARYRTSGSACGVLLLWSKWR